MADAFLILFDSPTYAIRAEKVLLGVGLKVKLVNVPRSIAEACGLALRVGESELGQGLSLLEESGIEVRRVYDPRHGGPIEGP